MKIELTEDNGKGFPRSIVEIDDTLLKDGRVQLSIDSWPGCERHGDTVSLTRDEAYAIAEHLKKVFEQDDKKDGQS